MDISHLYTAADIAKHRFESYLKEKLEGAWDESAWEFYTFLLEQAQKHHIDDSGYRAPAYIEDYAEGIKNHKFSLPEEHNRA